MPRLVRYLLARAGLQSTPPARGEYRSSPYSDTQNLLQLHWEWRGEQAQGFTVTALVGHIVAAANLNGQPPDLCFLWTVLLQCHTLSCKSSQAPASRQARHQ